MLIAHLSPPLIDLFLIEFSPSFIQMFRWGEVIHKHEVISGLDADLATLVSEREGDLIIDRKNEIYNTVI